MINPIWIWIICGLVTYLVYYHIINSASDDLKDVYDTIPPAAHFAGCVLMWPVIVGTILYIVLRSFKETYVDSIVDTISAEMYAVRLRYVLWKNKLWYLQKFRTLVLHFKDTKREMLFGFINKRGVYWTARVANHTTIVYGRSFTKIGAILKLIDMMLYNTLGEADFLVMADTTLTFMADTKTQSVRMVTLDTTKMLSAGGEAINKIAQHKLEQESKD